jgi:hypothetical protein
MWAKNRVLYYNIYYTLWPPKCLTLQVNAADFPSGKVNLVMDPIISGIWAEARRPERIGS